MKSKEKLNEALNKWILFTLYLVVISFPLVYHVSNVVLYSLWLLWLVKTFITPKDKRTVLTGLNRPILVLFLSLFLWQAISLTYNINILEGIKNVEGKLSLVFIPLLFFTTELSLKSIMSLFKAYVFSISSFSVFLLANLAFIYFSEGKLLIYHDFTNAIDLHAVFFSYYVFLNVVLTSYLYFRKDTTKSERVIYSTSILLSFIVLVISASKNVLAVTTVSLFLGYILSIKKRRIRVKEILILLFTILIGVAVLLQIKTIKNRVNEITELRGLEGFQKVRDGIFIEEEDINQFNGTSLRLTLWYLGVKTLREEGKLIQGLSAGDRKDVMNQKYFETGLNPWYYDYNLHNQFVQTFVELGLVGLTIYLVLIVLLFIKAIKDRNWLLTVFLSAFVIFQMTESVLERNKGIVFFIFIIMLLLKLNPHCNENRNIRN